MSRQGSLAHHRQHQPYTHNPPKYEPRRELDKSCTFLLCPMQIDNPHGGFLTAVHPRAGGRRRPLFFGPCGHHISFHGKLGLALVQRGSGAEWSSNATLSGKQLLNRGTSIPRQQYYIDDTPDCVLIEMALLFMQVLFSDKRNHYPHLWNTAYDEYYIWLAEHSANRIRWIRHPTIRLTGGIQLVSPPASFTLGSIYLLKTARNWKARYVHQHGRQHFKQQQIEITVRRVKICRQTVGQPTKSITWRLAACPLLWCVRVISTAPATRGQHLAPQSSSAISF